MAKVLLVEDDNNLREIFDLRLQADGYTTLSAGDGEEALVIAMKEKPDLIIADVMMPKMSGFEMLENLRAAPEMAKTKVIMMTALGQAEDQARGAKLGVVKYLVKSQVTLEDFARVVREVLGTPAAPGTNSTTEASLSNNNKAESEKNMDDTTPTNPTTPADGGATPNPMGGAASTGDQQSTAEEQSTVQSQVNDFASSTPAAPAGGDTPATPPADGSGSSDVPVTPAPTPPADGSDTPPAPAGGDTSAPA